MPQRLGHNETLYLDEAEGFLLEHALISPPRKWPPLPPEALAPQKRKVNWEEQLRTYDVGDEAIVVEKHDDADKERCVICLMALRDRTIVGVCGHEFCFECIGVWSNQSRRCPLCSADMAPFLLHDLDNSVPTKFYLPPLPQKRQPNLIVPRTNRPLLPEERDRVVEADKQLDELDIQVRRRREVYEYGLYAKHIGANPHTRFRPNPTPRQMAEDPVLIQRATTFLRRELRVWSQVDVEFLTTYVLSLSKAIDIRSEPAVRLLADFLEPPTTSSATGSIYPNGPEHLAHELYSFLRSPFKELWKWDEIVQYDPVPTDEPASPPPPSTQAPKEVPPAAPNPLERGRSQSRSSFSSRSSRSSRSPSYSRSPSRRRSLSRSSSRRPRNPQRRDTYIADASPGRKWNEADHWIDPEYAEWMAEEKRREEERREMKRRRSMLVPLRERIELLPSSPARPLRMDEEALEMDDLESHPVNAGTEDQQKERKVSLSIRGAAETTRRLSLAERLAKAKAEAADATTKAVEDKMHDPVHPPPLVHSQSDPTQAAMSKPGVRAAVQARLRLRLKLASEKKTFVFNLNESRAQELRAKILEAKAHREAEETDAVLREMDKVDRAKEVRRRLMVLKMMAAETETERRARELKEKLVNDKKARTLREKLLSRKQKQADVEGGEATPVQASA